MSAAAHAMLALISPSPRAPRIASRRPPVARSRLRTWRSPAGRRARTRLPPLRAQSPRARGRCRRTPAGPARRLPPGMRTGRACPRIPPGLRARRNQPCRQRRRRRPRPSPAAARAPGPRGWVPSTATPGCWLRRPRRPARWPTWRVTRRSSALRGGRSATAFNTRWTASGSPPAGRGKDPGGRAWRVRDGQLFLDGQRIMAIEMHGDRDQDRAARMQSTARREIARQAEDLQRERYLQERRRAISERRDQAAKHGPDPPPGRWAGAVACTRAPARNTQQGHIG